jgi:hypothetical protein
VTTAIGVDDYGYSVVLQSDGKIVLAGWSRSGNDYDFAVARYNNAIPTGMNFIDNEDTGIKIYPNPFSVKANYSIKYLF